jgi:hypothetical protein
MRHRNTRADALVALLDALDIDQVDLLEGGRIS